MVVAFVYSPDNFAAYPSWCVGEEVTHQEEIDLITGLSVADMEVVADDLYRHRGELEGDVVPSEPVSEVRSVVSVRFSRAELDAIAAAAQAASQPISTYIRQAALSASNSVDLDAARRQLRTATRALDLLCRSLGAVA